ncbi:MAG TPA: nicotinate-nucleotide--dimethylbenzimidazole phosphoribosyltransferase [Acidimicrobiia bacterium]|nr:nicotinate-nucleotide--dimethylbenzimidazole phosphoribosyltransferase [Acidimicrobiia bacterium]
MRLEADAMDAARARLDRLAKPPGSLGRLEDLAVQLAGLAGTCPPPTPANPAIAVFAGDHGVVASGVTPWPQDITAAMIGVFARGGAAINVFAHQVGATVYVVDVGVAGDVSAHGDVMHRKVRAGTDDLGRGPAMTVADAQAAIDVGKDIARELIGRGHDLLVTGDMGIGNTTSAAALIAAFTGRDAADVTGRGTGIDDAMLGRKIEIVAAAVAAAAPNVESLALLSRLGGLEIAALAGYIVEACTARVPLVVDGVIACAAALVADAIAPGVRDLVIAGHRSTEPGASIALAHLGLEPLVDLELRLGEGTGAALAIPLVQTAARLLTEMATLDDL